jgi:hypothetical protein
MIKKIVFVFCNFLILVNALSQTVVWKEQVQMEGKFRIRAPGELVEKVSKIKTAMGETAYHAFVFKPTEKNPDNVFYIVNYVDYPQGTFHSDSTELRTEFFKTTIENSAIGVKGKLLYESDIQLDTHKGKIWRVGYNQGNAFIKSKCFLVGNRFYMIQTMTMKNKSMNLSADSFLDSFQVLE